jgi:hypothetical protein
VDWHDAVSTLGMFWPLGDPGKLRQAAGAYRQMARDLATVQAACQTSGGLVLGHNQGPPIDGFASYLARWQANPGYFPATIKASNQLASALEQYAQKVDEAHQRIIELATAAVAALAVGVGLTVFTCGGSAAAAGVTVAGFIAATFAEATGLSAAVATIVVGIGVGAIEGIVFDGIVQVEAVDVFHNQQTFNWGEFGISAAFGAVTGGLGAGGTMVATRVGSKFLPILADSSPTAARFLTTLGKVPAPITNGLIGGVSGGGLATGIDLLTTGRVNPDDVLIGVLSGAAGGAIGGAAKPGLALDPATQRLELVARTGDPANVRTGGPLDPRPWEKPYTAPPNMKVIGPGDSFDLNLMTPGRKYLWVIDPQGNFRIAPEDAPGTLGWARILKHGDLVPDVGGQLRGQARIGGEFQAEFGPNGQPTGRWIMDNGSSHTFARTTPVGVPLPWLDQSNLEAAAQLLGTHGVDLSRIVVHNVLPQ